jgi:hypothetical protein
MKAATIALALSTISAAAHAQATFREADDELTRCYTRNTLSLDDGISDARSIATALIGICREERRAVLRLGAPNAGADEIERAMRERELTLDRATGTVLFVRVEQKKRRAP